MVILDCLGDICPVPVMRLQNRLKTVKPGGSVLLMSDHSCVPRSIEDYCKKKNLLYGAAEAAPGVWEITVTVPDP
ncbi:MAG: sulfurtransferase TusA family protein [Clostridia bacterium]|nr:sulfurtransferase TusA family protein [Clostridia bacterium]